jgi:hypothetical protein
MDASALMDAPFSHSKERVTSVYEASKQATTS